MAAPVGISKLTEAFITCKKEKQTEAVKGNKAFQGLADPGYFPV
jgi:hypothetical protein